MVTEGKRSTDATSEKGVYLRSQIVAVAANEGCSDGLECPEKIDRAGIWASCYPLGPKTKTLNNYR